MTSAMAPTITRLLRPGLIGSACLAVLLAVLSMYLQPDFLLTLANQVWGCF
ncbi:MAG: hypothetical protein ACR2IX_07700 [Limnohabitans sp.]